MKMLAFFFLFCLFTFTIFAQEDVIKIINPSFEGNQGAAILPNGWSDYSTTENTPPDTQPGCFQVTTQPLDGETYIGMVARTDGSKESIFQKLEKPLKAGNCYVFDIYLAQSLIYLSSSKTRDGILNHNHPLSLVIKGTESIMASSIELAKSALVVSSKWQKHTFILQPIIDINYLILQATPDPLDPLGPGNILMDNMSNIFALNCLDKETLIDSLKLADNKKAQTTSSGERGHDQVKEYVKNNWGNFKYDERKKRPTPGAIDVLLGIEERTKLMNQKRIITIGIASVEKAFFAKMEAIEDYLLNEERLDWSHFHLTHMANKQQSGNWIAANDNFAIAIDYYDEQSPDYLENFINNNWDKVYYHLDMRTIQRNSAVAAGEVINKMRAQKKASSIVIGFNKDLGKRLKTSMKIALIKQRVRISDIQFVGIYDENHWLAINDSYAIKYR